MSGPNLQEQGYTPEPFGAAWKLGTSLFTELWEQVSILGSKEGREAHWSFASLPTSSGVGYFHSCTDYIVEV